MNPKIRKFFEKNSIILRDIKYIIRENGKTVIHLVDGRTVQTYHTVKEFMEALPTDQFFHPNKGVLVAASQIVNVSAGAYTMIDGRSFKYRVHNSQMHDMRLLSLGRRMEHIHMGDAAPELRASHFSILDKMPLPVCITEWIDDRQDVMGHFIYRYCNEAMLQFESLTEASVIGKTLTEVFPHCDPKRIVAYMDVALNGTVRVIEHTDLLRNVSVKLYCYQPAPNYCACIMVDHHSMTPAERVDSHSTVGILEN